MKSPRLKSRFLRKTKSSKFGSTPSAECSQSGQKQPICTFYGQKTAFFFVSTKITGFLAKIFQIIDPKISLSFGSTYLLAPPNHTTVHTNRNSANFYIGSPNFKNLKNFKTPLTAQKFQLNFADFQQRSARQIAESNNAPLEEPPLVMLNSTSTAPLIQSQSVIGSNCKKWKIIWHFANFVPNFANFVSQPADFWKRKSWTASWTC